MLIKKKWCFMSSCWYVHTEQCDDSNSSPRAGLCISAGLSDRRASGMLFRSGITKVPHLEERRWMPVLERGRERVQHLWSPPRASAFSLWKRRCPAALDPPKKKASPHRPNQSSGAPSRPLPALPQQVPERSLGGLAACYHAHHGDTCLWWGF